MRTTIIALCVCLLMIGCDEVGICTKKKYIPARTDASGVYHPAKWKIQLNGEHWMAVDEEVYREASIGMPMAPNYMSHGARRTYIMREY